MSWSQLKQTYGICIERICHMYKSDYLIVQLLIQSN